MDATQILIDMERKPGSKNRGSMEFVESVDRQLNQGGLETTIFGMMNFVIMAVTRGVYIDAGLGSYDVIVYVANNIAFRHMAEAPDENTLGVDGGIVATVQDLRKLSETSLFVAGFMGERKLRDDEIDSSFFVKAGKKGYEILGTIARSRTHNRRFNELAMNFENYADALAHTQRHYFS